MRYKAANVTMRNAKVPHSVVTGFISCPDLVGKVYDSHNEWIKSAGSKFGVQDVGAYVRNALTTGNCILVRRNKDYVIVCCKKLVATVQLPGFMIVNVQHP